MKPLSVVPHTCGERKAGRELDAEVAERVFGFKVVRDPNDIDLIAQDDSFVPTRRVPPYSTDIAAAWLVVEKLSDRFHCRIKTPFMAGEKYFAGFTPLGVTGWNGRPDHEGSGDTAPLAICLAALATSPRCESVTGGGRYRCNLPSGHEGEHAAAGVLLWWRE